MKNLRFITVIILLFPLTPLPAAHHQEFKFCPVYNWVYDSIYFKLSLPLSKKDYAYYHHKSKTTVFEKSYTRFATEDSGHFYFAGVLKALDSLAEPYHFNKSQFAGFLIAFVQQAIIYRTDPFNWGKDYPRYGIETLVDKHGDCEDMACLLLGLLRTLNYDVALIALNGHMATGIACKDCSGRSFILRGNKYFFLESTGPGNPIGYESYELQHREHRLYEIPQTSFYIPQSCGPQYCTSPLTAKLTVENCDNFGANFISNTQIPTLKYGNRVSNKFTVNQGILEMEDLDILH